MAWLSSFQTQFAAYKASKTVLFWGAAGSVVAVLLVGFQWGGWVTGRTAAQMSTSAAATARAELAAVICVERFVKSPDAGARFASLQGIDSWKRNDLIEQGGWATPPGVDKPVSGAATLCVRQLMDAKPS